MSDSLDELEFLVTHFYKFGEPGLPEPQGVQQANSPLAAPDKVTVRWLIDNVSLNGWGVIVGLAFALLAGGYAAGRYDTVRKLIADATALFSSSPPPH
jgi:hypothetical protein